MSSSNGDASILLMTSVSDSKFSLMKNGFGAWHYSEKIER